MTKILARAANTSRLGSAAALLLFCAIIGCQPTAHRSVDPPLRVGDYLWPGSYWIAVAWKKGWFAEEGLNVERFDVHGKYFPALDAVAQGRLDVVGFSQFDLVRHVAKGEDLVGIAAIDYSVGAEGLVARPGMRRFADLKGKRLALQRGTYMEYLLSIAAAREGLDIDGITLVDRSQDESLADFAAGRVDAVLVWEPYVSRAQAAGGVTLFSTADYPGLTYSVLALRHEYLESHPREVAALIRVWHRGEQFVRSNPEETCEIVAELFDVSLASARNLMARVRVLDLTDNRRAFSYAAGFDSLHGSWRRMNDFMQQRGLTTTRSESPEHLNSSFIGMLN